MTDYSTSIARSATDVGDGPLRNLVEQGTGGTLFHRYGWLRAVEEGLDWTPRHVVVRKGENPVGVLPTFGRGMSLPHPAAERIADAASIEQLVPPPPGYGGPVVVGDEKPVVERLFDGVEAIDDTTLFHRVQTHGVDSIRYGRMLELRGYEPQMDRCTFVLDLDADWETIRGRMDAGRRKAIRRSEEQDAEVTVSGIDEDTAETHRMYVQNVERVGGTPRPLSFFEAVAEHVPESVLVFRAFVDGDEVGRYLHLLDENASTLHHWFSAIPESDEFEHYPSELLHASAIQWGIDEGYDRYSFGPTAPHLADSVFRFKERYGGRAVPLLTWEKGTLPVAWQAYKTGRSWYNRTQMEG